MQGRQGEGRPEEGQRPTFASMFPGYLHTVYCKEGKTQEERDNSSARGCTQPGSKMGGQGHHPPGQSLSGSGHSSWAKVQRLGRRAALGHRENYRWHQRAGDSCSQGAGAHAALTHADMSLGAPPKLHPVPNPDMLCSEPSWSGASSREPIQGRKVLAFSVSTAQAPRNDAHPSCHSEVLLPLPTLLGQPGICHVALHCPFEGC